MNYILIQKNDTITPSLENILKEILPEAIALMDDISDIAVEEMQVVNPIGETHELNDLTMWEPQGELTRYIFSASGHFDPIVDGHVVLGPFTSDKQLRWWFWYLKTVLGGEYTPKVGTGNRTSPNDYPSEALLMMDDAVEARLQTFLNDLFGDF